MKSPYRQKILDLLETKNLTAAQLAEKVGSTRDLVYTVLTKMHRAGLISMQKNGTGTVWKKLEPTFLSCRPEQVRNGTVTERLTGMWFSQPARAGAMDAYSLPSKFHYLKGNP